MRECWGPFFLGTETTPPYTGTPAPPLLWFYALWATDSDKDTPAMPLLVTPYYERRLRDLRTLSPDTAALAERIALELQPQVLATSTETLEAQLLDHLQEVAEQQARCVTRFWDWLNAVVDAGALTPPQAAAFACEAATLGGPSGVVPE